MTKLAQVVMILFIIFECQYMETFREMGESPALEFAPMTEWIFYVICTASSLIKHMTLCCVRLLWYTTGKIWIAYLGLWFCSVHINQHNSCLQHFLKQILNTTCSFVVLLVFLNEETDMNVYWILSQLWRDGPEKKGNYALNWREDTLRTKCSGSVYDIITFRDLAI